MESSAVPPHSDCFLPALHLPSFFFFLLRQSLWSQAGLNFNGPVSTSGVLGYRYALTRLAANVVLISRRNDFISWVDGKCLQLQLSPVKPRQKNCEFQDNLEDLGHFREVRKDESRKFRYRDVS